MLRSVTQDFRPGLSCFVLTELNKKESVSSRIGDRATHAQRRRVGHPQKLQRQKRASVEVEVSSPTRNGGGMGYPGSARQECREEAKSKDLYFMGSHFPPSIGAPCGAQPKVGHPEKERQKKEIPRAPVRLYAVNLPFTDAFFERGADRFGMTRSG